MLDTFACPVCGSQDRSPVETFLYRRTDHLGGRALPFALLWRRIKTTGRTLLVARPRRRPVTCRSLSRYQFLRRRVLFDVWVPTVDTVTLASGYCEECGFMAYLPRPTEQDIAAKYAYLKQVEPDIGGQAGYDTRALRSDLVRAGRVFHRCAPRLDSGGTLRVLDYGGGNGKLLEPFVAAGHSCFIVDYNDDPIPGVTKICDDMSSFAGDDVFDLIICSHVLEHVSDLTSLATFFRHHLDPAGLLYVEVPQEIWAGLRLEADPVTHVNFFTRNSLARLFLINGFEILESRQQVATYGGTALEVLWILARPAERGGEEPRAAPGLSTVDLPADVRALLYPSRRATLRRVYEVSLRPRLKSLRPRDS